MTDTGYAPGSSTAASGGVSNGKPSDYWSLSKCKKAYIDYLGNKTEEINEQKESRRYYHGAHWTAEQIKVLRKRRQPIATRNRIARKIDSTVGLIERLKQEPKAFPRTQQQDQGAELATAVIRYVLDAQEWDAKAPECARDGAVDGIGGIELVIEQGDKGDPDVAFELVEPDSFFYDPRSFRPDFSDAGYMGMGKWTDLDTVKDMYPDEDFGADDGSDLTSNPDREQKWFSLDGSKKLVRLVDIWYKHKGKWCWAIFTGSKVLDEGESPFTDEKKQTTSKYIMFSCNVDHDGDRYGFIRHMKSAQDSLNYKNSKLNHILGSRRLIMSQGAVQDIELARREWSRDDGVVLVNGNVNDGIKADDRTFDFAGWQKLLEEDKLELDNYGPNQALIGDIKNQSGRAIQLLQQAGMAELGPYILGYRGWKIRVYRALFSAVQKFWQAERWVRVTDDDGLAQFIQINGVGVGPDGHPTMVNALGSLDVDIVMDEGPDTINAQQDIYETLSNVLPVVAPMLNPIEAQATVGILIESSALPASAKKKFRDASQQAAQQPPPPNPEIEKTKIQLAAKQQETGLQLQAKQQENAQQMEFERQKAGATMSMQQMQHEQALQQKREQSAVDAELEEMKLTMQFHHEREKLRLNNEGEREKLHYHVEAEREKLGASVQTEREKQQVHREMHTEKIDGERKKVEETKRDPNIEKLATSLSEMAAGVVKMSESIEDMGEKIAAPKKIIRDKTGKIIGAESVSA